MAESQMSLVADKHGFVVVYPNAYTTALAPTASWLAESYSSVDFDFIARLINRLSGQLCVDRTRIYAAGYSSGGAMSYALACRDGATFAAIGAVAGFYPNEQDARSCRPKRFASMITIQGTADTFGRGTDRVSGFAWTRRWAGFAGCNRTPGLIWERKDVKAVAYTQCRGATGVQLYTVRGGGHTWPGSPRSFSSPEVGYSTQTIHASDTLWRFFQAHPRR